MTNRRILLVLAGIVGFVVFLGAGWAVAGAFVDDEGGSNGPDEATQPRPESELLRADEVNPWQTVEPGFVDEVVEGAEGDDADAVVEAGDQPDAPPTGPGEPPAIQSDGPVLAGPDLVEVTPVGAAVDVPVAVDAAPPDPETAEPLLAAPEEVRDEGGTVLERSGLRDAVTEAEAGDEEGGDTGGSDKEDDDVERAESDDKSDDEETDDTILFDPDLAESLREHAPGDGPFPRITDPCAASEPPGWCPGGVGGTVVEALDGDLLVLYVSWARRASVRCPRVPTREEFTLLIVSTRPGQFTVESRAAGSAAPPAHEYVVTLPSEVERGDDAGLRMYGTCVVLPREGEATTYEIQIAAVATGDDGERLSDLFRDTVEIGGENRPPVTIVDESDRLFTMQVPSREDERVEVTTIERLAGEDSHNCDRIAELEDDPLTPRERLFRTTLLDDVERVNTFWDGENHLYRSLWTYPSSFPGNGVYDLCITWYRDVIPNPVITEREVWTVIPPVRGTWDFTLDSFRWLPPEAGFGPPDGFEDTELMTGLATSVDRSGGRQLCFQFSRVEPPDAGLPNALVDAPRPMCSFEWNDDNAEPVVIIGGTGADPGAPFGIMANALSARSAPTLCSDSTVPCHGSTAFGVASGVRGADGSGNALYGVANVSYQQRDVPAYVGRSPDWVIANSGDFAVDPPVEADFPQLVAAGSYIEYDPRDPFTMTVHWQADREVDAEIRPVDGVLPGTRCRPDLPFDGPLGDPTARMSGTFEYAACPGTNYSFELRLTDAFENTAVYGPRPTGTGGAVPSFFWAGGNTTTPPINLQVTYGLRIRHGDTGAPEHDGYTDFAHVEWTSELGDHRFHQYRRSGFIVEDKPSCHDLEEYDVSADQISRERISVEAGATLPLEVTAFYNRWGRCNTIVHHKAGPAIGSGPVVLRDIPLYDLLETGRYEATATREVARVGDISVTATLTVAAPILGVDGFVGTAVGGVETPADG